MATKIKTDTLAGLMGIKITPSKELKVELEEIEQAIARDPQASNLKIAKMIGVSDKTVAKIRAKEYSEPIKEQGELSYKGSSDHLHVIGPQVTKFERWDIVSITIEPFSDENMNGSAYEVIIEPGKIRIPYNKDYMFFDRKKERLVRTRKWK